MNTGTPLDLTPFGSVLQGIGILYWLLALGGLIAALIQPKRWWGKALAVTCILVGFGWMPVRMGWQEYQARKRVDVATAHFEMRCKSAGEKIARTVENVDGLFIVNQRPSEVNFSDQYKLDDPYGHLGSGDNYIRLFLRGRATRPMKIGEVASPSDLVRYQFVETASEGEGAVLRYTTPMGKVQSESITRNGGGVVPLDREAVTERAARYGIEWADISTPEDRSYWVAGSRLRIIDLVSHDVIAERIGYMFDRGLGDTTNGRSPWAFARANACPALDEKTFYFFDRVLIPIKGETK